MALLPDRKLVSFEDQPLSAVPSGKEGLRCLLYFHFEDQLKKRYRLTLFQVLEGRLGIPAQKHRPVGLPCRDAQSMSSLQAWAHARFHSGSVSQSNPACFIVPLVMQLSHVTRNLWAQQW